MLANSPNQSSASPAPSIFLDYGADGERCNDKEMRLCERGMCFKSRWQFELGTELAIALTCHDQSMKLRRVDVQGVIAECKKICAYCHQITLLFIDLPDDAKPVLAEIAHRLETDGSATRQDKVVTKNPERT